MPDVKILDVLVPAEFYKSLSPIRSAGVLDEIRITQRMKNALELFLRRVARDAYRDSGLRTRTGTLKRSLEQGLVVWGDYRVNSIRGYFMVPEYVAAQEYGATILPKNAQTLCVPLPAALRPDGSPKRRSPALWKPLGTFSYRSARTGRGYLAYKEPGGSLVLLYVYVDRVDLPARLGLRQHYRMLLPLLMTMWESILVEEVANAYGRIIRQIGRALR